MPELSDYSQFNSGDYSFGDVWGSGQGLNQGQYQSLADSLGYTGNIFAENVFNNNDPLASLDYQAYLQNPVSPDTSKMRLEGDWLNPDFKNSLSSLTLQNAWDENGNQNWNVFNPNKQQINSFRIKMLLVDMQV